MRINFSPKDIDGLRGLEKIREYNFKVIGAMSDFLENDSCQINEALLNRVKGMSGTSTLESFIALFVELSGLEEDNDSIVSSYLEKAIHPSELNVLENDPYYQNIHTKDITYKDWKIKKEFFVPYQAFVSDDIEELTNFIEIPHLGFFQTTFPYLAVAQNNQEWMTITPNEIETVKEYIKKEKGTVLTSGLGLGYFAYMVSLKESVEKVIIVERDQNVIDLFTNALLPQFEEKKKITVIHQDIFDYLKEMGKRNPFDFIFFDLWHDVSDGEGLYLSLKSIEKEQNQTFYYWIENSIISHLRWKIYQDFLGELISEDSGVFISKLANEINGIEDLKRILSTKFIKENAYKLGRK